MQVYTFTPQQLQAVLAKELGVLPEQIKVEHVVKENSMDGFSWSTVTATKVTAP